MPKFIKMQIREKLEIFKFKIVHKKTEFSSISGFFEIFSKFWVFLEFLQNRDFLENSELFQKFHQTFTLTTNGHCFEAPSPCNPLLVLERTKKGLYGLLQYFQFLSWKEGSGNENKECIRYSSSSSI
jgi:hypothetical protein